MDVVTQMAMKDWRSLNRVLSILTEEQLTAALEYEKTGPRRQAMLVRVHQRLTRVRNDRERAELIALSMGGAK